MSVVTFLDRLALLPRTLLLLLGSLAVGLVGLLDLATGYEFGCSVFYLVPVLLVGWTVDRKAGLGFSLAAASLWLAVDITSAHRYSHVLLPYWNGLVRFAIFSLTVLLVDGFRDQRTRARTDFLTGLPNRSVLEGEAALEIERARRHSRPLTFAYLDCDGFKLVNDRFGHAEGDLLLRLVAETLRRNLRRFDCVARLGGDEFGVLLPETGASAARAVLGKLQAAVRQATVRWSTTISIGAVTFQTAPTSVEEMLRLADSRLYQAKAAGKGALDASVVEASSGERTGKPDRLAEAADRA